MSLLKINKKKPSIKYCLQYLPLETLKLINDYRPAKKKYFNNYKNKRKINKEIKNMQYDIDRDRRINDLIKNYFIF
jgi:hypothetical protein